MNKTEQTSVQRSWFKGRLVSGSLTVLAAVLLLVSLKFPLWQMRLEAPQYRGEEALRISVLPSALHGDLRELSVLNQYIGVHVPPALPQFNWLPEALIGGGVLGIFAALLPLGIRRRALITAAAALTAALVTAAVQAKSQIYDIGHNRDQHTPLVGVHDFTPPFLGTTKIAQFEVSSRFGLGAWLIGAALALQLGAAWKSRAGVSPVQPMLQHGQISSASGFSSVINTPENVETVSTASRAIETVKTISDFPHATDTGLKPDVNETRNSRGETALHSYRAS